MDTKRYDIVLTDMAKSDLNEIYNYIFKNRKEPSIANKLLNKIEKGIFNLENSPYRCMEVHIKPRNRIYRRLVISNYVVLYRVVEEANQIVIFHILYGGRDYLE